MGTFITEVEVMATSHGLSWVNTVSFLINPQPFYMLLYNASTFFMLMFSIPSP